MKSVNPQLTIIHSIVLQLLVVGLVRTPSYGLFVSHKHPDGHVSIPSINCHVIE